MYLYIWVNFFPANKYPIVISHLRCSICILLLFHGPYLCHYHYKWWQSSTPLSPLCVVEGSIDGPSTVSTHSLCSNLKAVTRPLDIKHSKAAFKDDENLCQSNYLMTIQLILPACKLILHPLNFILLLQQFIMVVSYLFYFYL